MGNSFLLAKQCNVFETNSSLSIGYFEICFVYVGVVQLLLLASSQTIKKKIQFPTFSDCEYHISIAACIQVMAAP